MVSLRFPDKGNGNFRHGIGCVGNSGQFRHSVSICLGCDGTGQLKLLLCLCSYTLARTGCLSKKVVGQLLKQEQLLSLLILNINHVSPLLRGARTKM